MLFRKLGRKLGINIYGYSTGIAIACLTVGLAVYTGYLYGQHTAPEPCIKDKPAVRNGEHVPI